MTTNATNSQAPSVWIMPRVARPPTACTGRRPVLGAPHQQAVTICSGNSTLRMIRYVTCCNGLSRRSGSSPADGVAVKHATEVERRLADGQRHEVARLGQVLPDGPGRDVVEQAQERVGDQQEAQHVVDETAAANGMQREIARGSGSRPGQDQQQDHRRLHQCQMRS